MTSIQTPISELGLTNAPNLVLTCNNIANWDALFVQASNLAVHHADMKFVIEVRCAGWLTEVTITAWNMRRGACSARTAHRDAPKALDHAFLELNSRLA